VVDDVTHAKAKIMSIFFAHFLVEYFAEALQVLAAVIASVTCEYFLMVDFLTIYCTDLHQIFRIGRAMGSLISRAFILRSLKYVAMATNFRGKIGEIGRPSFVRRAGVPKWIKCQNADDRVNSAMNSPAWFKKLVSSDAVPLEFTRLECVY